MAGVSKNDVNDFVEAAHRDLAKVTQMLEAKPELLNMPNGNETALGAACQMRRVDIIEFLLGQGAPLTLSAACVLGQTDKVEAFLAKDPSLLSKGDKQSHMKHPIYFAEKQPATLAMLKGRGAK
jgi:ankyrin repeat protein